MATNLKFPGQALQDEDVVSRKVEAYFARQLARLDATTALGLKLLKGNETMTIPRALGIAPKVVVPLYGKILKTARLIRVAAWLSLVDDAQVLCRTLAETAIAIRYILQKHSARRAEEYVAHTLMRTKGVMKSWRTRGLKRRAQPIEKAADEILERYKHLGEKRLKELTRWYSGDDALWKTFKRVGLEKFYQMLYLQFAGVQHVSDAERHVEFDEKGTLIILLGSSSEGQMNVVLHTTNALLWLTMARLSRKFKLGYQAEIESMKPEHPVYDSLRAWRRRRRAKRQP